MRKSGKINGTVAAGGRIAAAILREWITPEDIARIASGKIHPGDVCDENIAIYGAFAAIHFDTPDAANQDHAKWMNLVYTAAMAEIAKGMPE